MRRCAPSHPPDTTHPCLPLKNLVPASTLSSSRASCRPPQPAKAPPALVLASAPAARVAEHHFPPKLLNYFDTQIVFNRFSKNNFRDIVTAPSVRSRWGDGRPLHLQYTSSDAYYSAKDAECRSPVNYVYPHVDGAAVHKALPPAAGPSQTRHSLFVERTHTPNDSVTDLPTREVAVAASAALTHILNVPPPHTTESIYLRALFYATGCPEKIRKEPVEWGDEGRRGDLLLSSWYGSSPRAAWSFNIARDPDAAKRSSIELPHPTYVYGLGAFTATKVEERYYVPLIPQGSSPTAEARKHIERAAYLDFAPAQYKLGHAYEYAAPPFSFDPLLSVQYYSYVFLASSILIKTHAPLVSHLNKGAFEKDERLAVTFPDKAAKKGLHSAEFAIGYYAEVGIGQSKDLEAAKKWPSNTATRKPLPVSPRRPQSPSRTQHHTLTNDKLVRRRTQAHGQAVAAGRVNNANHAPTAAEKVKREALKGANSSEAPVMPATLPPLNNAPPRHASTMPPGQAGGPPPPQQQGGPQQERPFANAPRYTLSDTPSPPPAGAAVASHPSQSGRVAGRPPGRRYETVQHVGGGVGSPAPPPV
ncbi:hypothetical protein M422DRAFT_274317 [Sphaerobolus stellatus SS14]|uniref:Uncharacterized protein n=1 Tax=Sphaerobolus stellatus (strain SS14) TaxID=990650 RepID=A0A0C9T778_SPHS4|nr:hypothetical protein M422DRAFT_274317 [Sphaerobolus stellatus SS14]